MSKLGEWLCKHGIHNRKIYGYRYRFRYPTLQRDDIIEKYDIAKCKRCGKEFYRENDEFQLSFWKEGEFNERRINKRNKSIKRIIK